MRKPTTAGELKRLLADVPDDTPLLVEHADHSYRLVSGSVTDVAVTKDKRGGRLFSEWFGDKSHYNTPVEVIKAVVLT